jgi:hypothetical protein
MNKRNLMQSARPDAIRALLVFLHLLERETERFRQFLLAHAKHLPPHPHSGCRRVGQLDLAL